MESRKLDSWKEIAAHFGRDERTVRRWEKTEALPIHRHLHHRRGSVYAFHDELDRWQAQRGPSTNRLVENRAGRWRFTFLIGGVAVGAAGVALTLWMLLGHEATINPGRTDEAAATRWLKNPIVRQNFLLARHHLDRRAGFRREAQSHLEAAIKEAPDFPEPHAWLAEIYLRDALAQPAARAAAWLRAEAEITRALSLDNDLAIAHATLSRIALYRDWDWPTAAAESQRAIELDPASPNAHSARAVYLRTMGRSAEAILARERACRADPVNPQWLVFLGDEYVFARRYDDGADAYTRALQLEHNYLPAVTSLADVYGRQGRYEEAADWQTRTLRLRNNAAMAAAFDAVRQQEGARAALQWIERRNHEEYMRAPDRHVWNLAYSHARLGHTDEALAFLARALEHREAGILQARLDPDLDSLRNDRRFIDLLARVVPASR
jgi:tetratricopeptide (TPR) repeat protein